MQTIDRLLESFTPEHYELSLTLDRAGRTFHGLVTISGIITNNDNALRVHAKDLTIRAVLVDGKEAKHSLDGDELTIVHPHLSQGAHLVTITFSGAITDPMHGLYPCYYTHDGVKKELLATQFESHHAREVFPCIDEPSAKATFSLTLSTETGVTALSNMPVLTQRTEHDLLVTEFDRTPRMSTYLLAWVVGELHKTTGRSKSGAEVSIWATPAQPAESLDLALDIATRTIDFFDEYFDTPYPLPKSDHVALPDFSSGAMENWGLITYREIALLSDPATTSLENKRQVALVIAHELSHQWFGNLVTMAWWDDLWLNESFADMMEYIAIDALEPSWNVWLDHASSEVIHALRRDSLDGVQAIQTAVNHPDEIITLFDPSIVYAKGGRLLRMLQAFIGDNALQEGLKEYFKKFAYQNTKANDLWECLGASSGQDVAAIMNTWIRQPGFPIIDVSYSEGQVHLEQSRFFIGQHEASSSQWPIPLGSTDPALPALMTEKQLSIATDQQPPLLNHDSTAHYIADYSPELRAALFARVPELSDIDRLKLLNEHTLLAQSGRLRPAELIGLLDYYRNETNEAVWSIIALVINDLKKYVEDDEAAEQKLRVFVRELAHNQYERLGWEPVDGESDSDTKLRSLVIALTLYGQDADAGKKAAELYENVDVTSLDPNLRVAILSYAVRELPSSKTIEPLLALHNSSNSSELREDIVLALTSTKDIAISEKLLALIKDSTVVRAQDVMRWFLWLLRNHYSRTQAWQWVRDNWSWFEVTFEGDKSYDIYPRYIASTLTKELQRDEYIEFFTPKIAQPSLKRNIEMGITELSHRVSLIAAEGPAVREALLKL